MLQRTIFPYFPFPKRARHHCVILSYLTHRSPLGCPTNTNAIPPLLSMDSLSSFSDPNCDTGGPINLLAKDTKSSLVRSPSYVNVFSPFKLNKISSQ